MVVTLSGEILFASDSLYPEATPGPDVYYVTPIVYAVSYAFSILMIWMGMK